MKLRIQGNSIRLRLSRTDVATLAVGTPLIEHVAFGPGSSGHFIYSLETGAVQALEAHHIPGHIRLTMPTAWAQTWLQSDTVGFEGQQEIAPGQFLKLLVEKDFKCLDQAMSPDQADAFPNPNKTC
jgi:hypothetical protein